VSKRTLILAALLCLAGYVYIYAGGLAHPVIRSDGVSYYVYLPSWFLFRDTTLAALARDCCGGQFPEFTAIIRWPETRRWVNAHPIGAAIMQAPAFAVAHGLTRWSNLAPDGFSFYYQHAVGLAGLAWFVAGLAVLRGLLRRHFTDRVTAATLAVLLLGTNLFHYATFDSSYSHPYSFFLFAALLDLTDRWHAAPTVRRSVLIGLVSGLIVLTRHTNVLGLILFPLFGVASRAAARERLALLRREWRHLAVIVVVGMAVLAPQLAIYYQATGRVLVSAYGDLGFNWGSPQVFEVLVGVTKGLFFWSPVLLLALPGFWWLHRSRKAPGGFVLPGVLFLAAHTYIIASWWDWQFGGSYGHRGFVDTLPIFALGLAAAFERVASHATVRLAVTFAVSLAVALSIFQMLQYWHGIIPFNDTTWEQYRALFLRWP
jgi:hypothetical protein